MKAPAILRAIHNTMPDARTLAEHSAERAHLCEEATSRAKGQSESVEAERTGILQLARTQSCTTQSCTVPHIAPDQVVVPRCSIDER